jgi:hypothetical protein
VDSEYSVLVACGRYQEYSVLVACGHHQAANRKKHFFQLKLPVATQISKLIKTQTKTSRFQPFFTIPNHFSHFVIGPQKEAS